jgi:hypothetical protein
VQKLTEDQIEQACLQYLTAKKWFAFKFKDQALFANGRYRRAKPFQINGVADAFASKDGKHVWIEFKTKTGSQSQSQKEFQKNIEMQGGNYWLIRSLDELKERLNNL